jgi:hypothetical protein
MSDSTDSNEARLIALLNADLGVDQEAEDEAEEAELASDLA